MAGGAADGQFWHRNLGIKGTGMICQLKKLQSWSVLNAYVFYYVGPDGWKKLSGDDVGELHYKYYPVMPSTREQEMVEVAGA
ncbi:hypothetical protein L1049_006104 [Liquidambar formosana]|uniref:Uncharacterized protein n=1 Tax=Liquidambar formosana TaxID=63359 RepID=A0AAP0RFE3_LIQFO